MIIIKNFHDSGFLKQVYVIYESMLERVPIMPKNQVNMSLLCVASPHLSKTGEEELRVS